MTKKDIVYCDAVVDGHGKWLGWAARHIFTGFTTAHDVMSTAPMMLQRSGSWWSRKICHRNAHTTSR